MLFSLDQIFQLLLHYKYLIIFPFAVFEGPIITIISGLLASQGHLNFYLALAVVFFGDLVGDTVYYCVGRFGREKLIGRFGKFLKLDEAKVEKIEQHFATHPWKTFTFGKFVHGTGSTILAAAGLARVPYFRFLGYNIPTALAKSAVLITIGFYFGYLYEQFNTYLDIVADVVLLGLISGYIYYIRKSD